MSRGKAKHTRPDLVRAKLAEVMNDAAADAVPAPIRDLADTLQRALDARIPDPSSDD